MILNLEKLLQSPRFLTVLKDCFVAIVLTVQKISTHWEQTQQQVILICQSSRIMNMGTHLSILSRLKLTTPINSPAWKLQGSLLPC